MSLYDHLLDKISQEQEEMATAIRLLREYFPHQTYKRLEPVQVLYILIDNQTFIVMANLSLKPGKRYTLSPGLQDAISKIPVPGATLVAKDRSVDNPAVAKIDADGKVAYVGAGTAQLTHTNTWTYKDEITSELVTVDKTSTVTITALAAAEVVEQTTDLTGEEDIPAV
jgi:hypothetical protein